MVKGILGTCSIPERCNQWLHTWPQANLRDMTEIGSTLKRERATLTKWSSLHGSTPWIHVSLFLTSRQCSCQNTSKNQDPDNAAVLDLHSTTALEGCLILVRAQAKRVPKSDRILHTKFLRRVEAGIASGVSPEEVSGNSRFPASTERGGSVQAPIAPSRTGQSILEETSQWSPEGFNRISTSAQHLFIMRISKRPGLGETNKLSWS